MYAAGRTAQSTRLTILSLAGVAALVLLGIATSVALADDTTNPNNTAAVAASQPSVTAEVATIQPGTLPPATKTPKSEPIELQNYRAHDIRGLNVFEPPKADAVAFAGQKLVWGFGFAQQYQGLHHSNSAQPKIVVVNSQNVNANQLIEIGPGFNNASANLYLDAQLARGTRVALTAYLSSRHHQETWVKDGYILLDASPIDNAILNRIMDVVTLRVGQFEINYGDAHFRRSDNGNAFFNPFVGNLLMDAFTTEIGAEAYARKNGFLAMAGVTGGEIHGQVTRPSERSPSYIAKLGVDRQLTQATRVRVTGSVYANKKSISNTLYSGSRAGSRYYSVLENTQSTETAQAWSGDVQPGFRNQVTAWVINPFIKYRGLEMFGNLEQAKGKAAAETSERTWSQYAGEGVYRFFSDQFYVGGRYNIAKGTLAGVPGDVKVDRVQTGGGWFVTPNVLAKAEYVRENYMNFPANDIRNGGTFHGFMVEGVVTF